ncbi:MAG TPA: Ig-like domain-containing protein, partial [Solirubrobacterales bacterium]|nr:Ig-like domain-containing protein [Solirubrobacterales bacterium]
PGFGFSYAPAAGDTLECSIDSGEAAFGPCDANDSHAAAAPLANGPYSFRLRATDSAGNTALATRAFEVDATDPETEITLAPAALATVASAKFEFGGEDPEGAGVASFECKLDAAPFTACASGIEYTGLSEGSHKFEVRAIDQAGNVDAAPALHEWTVDTVAPETQITLKPAPLANSSTAKFEFGGDDGAGSGVASFECRRDSTEPGDWTSCASGIEYTGLSQGSHKFEVRAIDGAGNVDASPASHEWSIDSLAPETQISAQPPALTGSSKATFEFTGSDPGGSGVASFQCRRDSTEPVGWQLCSSPRVYTSLAEGAHTFEVRAIDNAGSPDPSPATVEWEIDTKAPQTQIDVKPPALTNATTAKFELSGEDVLEGSGVASFECKLDAASFTACASGIEYTGLSEGAHKFEVRAIDQAGNIDATPASHEWTVDLTPPSVSVDSGPEGLTNDPTPTFAFSGEPGATFECSIDGGAPTLGPCSAAGSHTPAAPLADGPQTFRVRATDVAGNQAIATRGFTVDATAPQIQIDLEPAELTASDAATFEFSGDDGAGSGVASFECRRDSTEPGDWTSCSSGIEDTGLSEGSHNFEVRAIDEAGNIDGSPASHEWTIDLTPPTVQVDSGPEGLTNNSSPTFAFSGEPGASFQCSIDQGTPAFAPCSGGGSHTPAEPLANEAFTFRVQATDQAGNPATATREFEVNAAVPETPELTATVPISPANHNTPKVIGTAQAGTEVRIYDTVDCTGAPLATGTAAELESGGIEIPVADNSATQLRATVTAPPDNTSLCSEPIAYVEDSSAPTTQIDLKPAELTNATAAGFEFSGDDGAGSGVASFECRRDSTEPGDWTSCTTGIEYTGLSEGSHKFEVRAIDQAGNIDASPASHEWTVDLTPPSISVDGGPEGLTNNASPTFAFSGEAGATFQCSIDDGTPTFDACSAAGSHTPDAPLSDGPRTFRVQATDAAGNQATATRSFTVDTAAPQAPELLATDPASPANENNPILTGSAAPGTTVALYAGPDCSGSPFDTVTPAELETGVEVTVAEDSTTAFRATA